MTDFVTLTCPSCGGKLQITNDIEQFVCGHCGNEHIVRRGGGIIALAPVIESIKKVQTGTDKTASELAIKRLKEELRILESNTRNLIISVVTQWGNDGFLGNKSAERTDIRCQVIYDYLLEKGIISKEIGFHSLQGVHIKLWRNIELLFSLSIANFGEIEYRAQELCGRSKGEKRKAYEELVEWCKKVKELIPNLQDKSNELKLHEQKVKM